MKTYLVLFREPDGRLNPHTDDEIKEHRANWQIWQDELVANGQLLGGNALTLNGAVIGPQTNGQTINYGPYYVNQTEMVGGYLVIKAKDIDGATRAIKACPVFDFGAFAEIREMI